MGQMVDIGTGQGVDFHGPLLLDYEFVLSNDDFFVALNGPCRPSDCAGFRVDGNGCFVFDHADGEFVSLPIPDAFRSLVDSEAQILFVQFLDGVVADSKVLPLSVAQSS